MQKAKKNNPSSKTEHKVQKTKYRKQSTENKAQALRALRLLFSRKSRIKRKSTPKRAV
jgi:hypothetical protein